MVTEPIDTLEERPDNNRQTVTGTRLDSLSLASRFQAPQAGECLALSARATAGMAWRSGKRAALTGAECFHRLQPSPQQHADSEYNPDR
ncbi:hypothetical protein SSPSH_003709 [Salinisphaera shabanensis E1L3A]|uniref:Uncharacterized protein n=1 Tax=Salinisphaera shabanensis E1L3A TaxID=1033802 RepID=U2EGG3_9GAMM|nr:hypothetical protein SSPSH_003709 [Salinisphaera shabanensis E1L3A]